MKRNLISQRLLTVGRKGSYFRPWARDGGSLNHTSRGNGPLQPIKTVWRTLSVRNTALARKNGPSFDKLAKTLLGRMCAKRHRPSRSRTLSPTFCLVGKLLAEKTKKKLEEAAQSGSVDGIIEPPSPVRRHVKWKMARTKKTGEMTTEAAKEIAEKIDSFEEQATQGSFVPDGRQDVLTAAIGHPEHPGRVRAAGVGVTIKQYIGSAPRASHSSSSLPPEELQQLTQQIRDQLDESITEKVTRQLMASFSPMQSQIHPRVSTKGSCVDPSGNDPETGDSDSCGLYIEADPARLVAMGRIYEGTTVVHNTPLLPGQVKVSVEEVKDADAPAPVPTDEVFLVGQALHTFLAWPTHMVKSLSQQPDPKVDDPLYLMTLTILELFLRPYQVTRDATVFGVFNPDFLLYIKHEDLSEIAHGCQCLSISLIQLWILHWQMVVILPKEYLVVWFCSLHNRPDNYLKGIINSALKGLDDAPQPKSKAPARWIVVKCNRQKGSTECDYYVMHWMSTIILGTFRNNWEATIGARELKGVADRVGTVLSPS
ncbi:hypothetical protein HKD37_02G004490 [Glycine soja]